ncbi:hypothetical protein M8998_08665 [Sphingobacterium sp. lm-10]|uniref:hypothetical protein n=1 Tax=Sphingobacterium sp. lm-10 TaxID=2944904 RepID=UPI00202054C4|nr:hypothetical protein [Sphingobacterium sp. lm-10]MCL7988009.1 hypothetical protein [Sphingobacterium sp. lm-10]
MTILIRQRWIAMLILPLFFSCSTHYLATMQSLDMEKNETDSTFYSGTDTLGMSYAFNNQDGSVRIRFENYTEQPMMVDLSKSALIVNGRSYGFIDGKSFVQGRLGAQATTIDLSNNGSFQESTIRGGYSGTIYKDEDAIFIPAKSFAEGSYLGMHTDVRHLFKENFEGKKSQIFIETAYFPAKFMEYNAVNSPLKLRSHISYAMLDRENKPLHHAINVQNFYTSNITRIRDVGSKSFRRMLDTRSDMSGFSETSNTGAVVGTVLVLGAIGVAAALLPTEEVQ